MGRPSKAELAAREAAANAETEAQEEKMQETSQEATQEAEQEAELVEGAAETNDVPAGIPADGNADAIAALQEQIAELQAQLAEKNAAPSVVLAKQEETVKLTYVATVSDNNVLNLGDIGQMPGVGWVIAIPRSQFGGKFMTAFVQKLMKKRRLIVLDGLTAEERVRYGVDYKEGEVMDVQMFDKLLDMDVEKLLHIFENLCPEHQQFVATRFISAYEKGDNRIGRGLIEPLQTISKKKNPNGLFTPILEKMNKT